MDSKCTIEDCVGLVLARGYCRKHYMRWYKHKDPLKIGKPALNEANEKFIEGNKTVVPSGCWEWNKSKNKDGYGLAYVAGEQ